MATYETAVAGDPRLHDFLSLTDVALRRALEPAEGLFVAGSLGGGLHDGHLNAGPPDRKLLGSRLLFRESVEAGYQLTRRVSLSVMLDHLSNADLAAPNQGLTNFGVRIGVTF